MSEKASQVKLGLLQLSHSPKPQENLKRALEGLVKLAKQGAQILCLSELFLSQYFCQANDSKFFNLAQALPNEASDALAQLAKEKQVVIVASFFEKEVAQAKYFNTACVFDADGQLLGKYRKLHIPDDLANYYSESFYFSPGDLGLPVFETAYAKIGVQVCWDQWFPEGARALALKGAQIIFYPTAIGWPVGGNPAIGRMEKEAWVTVQQGHAISNTVFVTAVNRVGVEDNLNFWGSSFVAGPFGKLLAQAPSDQEASLVVDCDLDKINEVRKDWPFLSCRREDAYGL